MIQEANLIWRYVDTESNLVMPWYTLPALKWLKEQDKSEWFVFEYGAGYSTVWWRLNCNKVFSVDSDENWAQALNAEYYTDKKAYVESILFKTMPLGWHLDKNISIDVNDNLLDCIIVDGNYREECVKESINCLRHGGFLIIDNWDGDDFPHDAVERTIDLLKDWNREIHAQPNHSYWKTAIFQKP